jgi:peptidoglycan-associated lipoprotein
MTFYASILRLFLIGFTAFFLVACQTTNKTAETVEESTDSFEYIQAQAEQERLQQELEQAKQEQEQAKQEQERLQAEGDKAREGQALAEEKTRLEAEERARAQSEAAKARAEAAQARAEAVQARAEAVQAREGVVNDSVPMGMPVSSVYFDFDKSSIVPKFDDVIRSHVGYLRANPDLKVEIQGNCDERGSREYNIGLGNSRALSVKAALEMSGIQGSRITITSFGSEKPLALGHDESSWQQNRRADFVY